MKSFVPNESSNNAKKKFLVTLPLLDGQTDLSDLEPSSVEILNDESIILPNTTSSPPQELGVDKYSGELLPIEDWDVVRRNTVDAIASSDHVQICAYLKIYAESNITITDKELLELLGHELVPLRTGDSYDTFKFVWCGRIGKGKKKQKTWYVEIFNPIKDRIRRKSR